uniref:ElaC ribonuclease Z 1 n=1 Tax=Zosterops lateralis melanops TaxID=1220523 RepID=A0A8D2PU93_ZOSLA
MSLEITFLGTGAAFPSPARGASALVLRREGQCWLFDCGEGTQTQLMRSHLRAGRITKIFITHLHGDHIFGLPGLLCTLSLQSSPDSSSKAPLDIFGPLGLRSFLQRSLELSHSQLLFPYAVHELVPTPDQCPPQEFRDFSGWDSGDGSPGRVLCLAPGEDSYLLLEDEQVEVRAFRLFHRVPSFGFVLEEKLRPGRLNVQKLKDLGVQPGPLYGKLKSGTEIVLESGAVISPQDVLEPPVPGRKVCVLGDCSAPLGDTALRLCRGADLLVHEATLGDRDSPGDTDTRDSDTGDTRDNDVTQLRRQAEAVLDGQQVILAEDFMTIEIPLKKGQLTTEIPLKK